MIHNQEEVNTAGDKTENEFKWADIYKNEDDGLGEVNLRVNEGSSIFSCQEFEFCVHYIKDLDWIETIEDRVLE